MKSLLLCVLLLLPSVAWAGSYTGLAQFTSLSFTGIAVEPFQFSQNRELYFQPLQPEDAGILNPFDTHGDQEDWRPRSISSSDSIWTIQPNGRLDSIATDQRLATTITMTEAGGYGVGLTSRSVLFTALESGLLTYRVDFTLSHVGVPDFVTPFTDEDHAAGSGLRGPLDFSAVGDVSAGLSSPSDPGVGERASLDATDPRKFLTGTFTATRRFEVGEVGGFAMSTSLYANQTQSVASVPEPNASILLGLGILLLWAWRRRQAAC